MGGAVEPEYEDMKTLIVEGDFGSRVVLQNVLSRYGDCHIAVNGEEAIEAFRSANKRGLKYDLVCLDGTMPGVDAHETIKVIRAHEQATDISALATKILVTGALRKATFVGSPPRDLYDAELTKPIETGRLLDHLKTFGLVFDNQNYDGLRDDEIPGSDWDDFSLVRDLPLHLWMEFHRELVGKRAELSPQQRRIEFRLFNQWISLDPRLVARMYRSWWARLGFPLETCMSFRRFVEIETKSWPNVKQRGKEHEKRSTDFDFAPTVDKIPLSLFTRAAEEHGASRGFERLERIFTHGEITTASLRQVDPRQVDRLIESGQPPMGATGSSGEYSLIAAMVFAYLRRFGLLPEGILPPERKQRGKRKGRASEETAYKIDGLFRLLDDDHLPDFETDTASRKGSVLHGDRF